MHNSLQRNARVNPHQECWICLLALFGYDGYAMPSPMTCLKEAWGLVGVGATPLPNRSMKKRLDLGTLSMRLLSHHLLSKFLAVWPLKLNRVLRTRRYPGQRVRRLHTSQWAWDAQSGHGIKTTNLWIFFTNPQPAADFEDWCDVQLLPSAVVTDHNLASNHNHVVRGSDRGTRKVHDPKTYCKLQNDWMWFFWVDLRDLATSLSHSLQAHA